MGQRLASIRHYRLAVAIEQENTKLIEIILNELNVPTENMSLKERITYYYLLKDS